MRIGELAKKAGVNVQTIRFYERRKLLRDPLRTPSGYRSYSDADLDRVQFIKQSQQLGFTLKEVKDLLDIHKPSPALRRPANSEWQKAFQIARDRLGMISDKIAFLEKMRDQLVAVLRQAD